MAEAAALKALHDAMIAAVAVKGPPWYPEDPAMWFNQMNAQFHLAGITKEETKYYHVMQVIPSKVATEARHITGKATYETGDFDKLKAIVIKNYGESNLQRLNMILDTEQMGDRTPSQFYRFLQSKVGDMKVDDTILKNRWLAKLPEKIKTAISGLQKAIANWDELLESADNIFEICKDSAPSIAAVSTDHRQYRRRSNSVSSNCSYRSYRGRSKSPGRRNNRGFDPNGKNCWYHWRFGDKAQKCAENCQFKKGNSRQ